MGWKDRVIGLLPQTLIAPEIARRTWTNRATTADDDHLNGYWNSDTPRRRALIAIIVDELRRAGGSSVLEFGSHVGVNLRMLADSVDPDPQMYAVEPNFEAIEFMREKLPEVRSLRADHRGFLAARDFPEARVSVSFANAVFYCMSPRSTRRVLRKMLATSDVVVIGDNLANATGATSAFRADNGSFAHPFETWLRTDGADEFAMTEIDDGDYALSGFLVARRAAPQQGPDVRAAD